MAGLLLQDYWSAVLRENGFRGSKTRAAVVAAVLVENSLQCLPHLRHVGCCYDSESSLDYLVHLRHVDHPREWCGSEKLSLEEQEELWKLKKVARRRSKWVATVCGGPVCLRCVLQVSD